MRTNRPRRQRWLTIIGGAALIAGSFVVIGATPAAASTPHRFAVVDASGVLVRGSGVTTATWLGYGRFEVRFDRDVSPCSYTATIADPANGAVAYPGMVFTASGHLSKNGVYVETKNPGGGLSDYPFHLHVLCGDEGTWAVTDYAGGLVRGQNVASVAHLGTGQFEVTFTVPTKLCAYIATIGDPASALVFDPGIVTVAMGAAGATNVHVETRDIAGKLFDRPFHLQVQCPWRGWDEWAVVDAGGHFVRGMNVGGVAHVGAGRYEVFTFRNLAKCSYVATIGDPGQASVPGTPLVFTATGHTTPDAVYVETKDLNGKLIDLPFHLQISKNC